MQQENSGEKLTAQQWADMNAQALVERNKELLAEMIDRLDAASRRVDEDRERVHWRRVIAAAAIESGKTCDEAMTIADKMVVRLFARL